MVMTWSERVVVDAVDHGRQGGGFARAGRSGHQHQAALLLADLVDHARQVQFVDGANFRGDDAQHHADVAALLEDVDAEAAQAGHAVGHVELGGLLEFLLLAVGHHAERHGEHLFRRDAGHVGLRVQHAVHAQIGMVADLQVQVGGLLFDRAAQQIVNADSHMDTTPEDLPRT